MRKILKVAILSCLVIALPLGCSSTPKKSHEKHDANFSFDGQSGTSGYGFYGEELSKNQEAELLNQKVIYFDFDSSEISNEQKLIILAHTKKLVDNSRLNLRIEGHTDERGSAEYNIGLGERRAKAVLQLMATKGISIDRVTIVSFGKEKPKSFGHDESSWRLNRRAELVYE